MQKIKENKNQYDIISISHYFYPRVGGLERMAYELLKALTGYGYKTLAVFGGNENKTYQIDGIDCDSNKVFAIFKKTYPLFTIFFTLKLFKIFRENPQATIIVYDRHLTSSFVTAVVTKLLNRKYILIAQTTTSNYFENKLFELIGQILEQTIFKFVINSADQVICVSKTNQEFVCANLGVKPNKTIVIPNGFNSEAVSRFNIKDKEKIAIFATKWIPVKDPNTTAKAFKVLAKKYPDWKFYFIGQGDSIVTQMRNLPKNFILVPRFYNQQELFELLSKAAIYVNSSINEGLSVAVLEALALGTIPVLSDAPSNIEVAKSINSKFIFTRQNELDLVQQMSQAIKTFESQSNLKINNQIAQKTSELYSDKKVFARYQKFLANYRINKKTEGIFLPKFTLNFRP